MNEDQVHHFRAGPRAREATDRFLARRSEVWDAWDAFCDARGAENVYVSRGEVVGLSFEGTPPKGFRRSTWQIDMWVPNLRTRYGKEVDEGLKSLPRMRRESWETELLGVTDMGALMFVAPGDSPGSRRLRYVSVGTHTFGETMVLSVYWPGKGPCPTPMDSTPMKKSEFWALKEASEQGEAIHA